MKPLSKPMSKPPSGLLKRVTRVVLVMGIVLGVLLPFLYGSAQASAAQPQPIAAVQVAQTAHAEPMAPVQASPAATTAALAPAAATRQCVTVVPGQTLGGIASSFGTNADALAAENGIANKNLIYVGQQVCHASGAAPAVRTAPAPAAASANSVALRALQFAETKVGNARYVWGATGPNAFDCSGLVVWAFRQAGFTIGARNTQAMVQLRGVHYIPVSRGNVQAGDLVFFYSGPSHMGIAENNSTVVNAATASNPLSKQVARTPINAMPFYGAIRVVA